MIPRNSKNIYTYTRYRFSAAQSTKHVVANRTPKAESFLSGPPLKKQIVLHGHPNYTIRVHRSTLPLQPSPRPRPPIASVFKTLSLPRPRRSFVFLRHCSSFFKVPPGRGRMLRPQRAARHPRAQVRSRPRQGPAPRPAHPCGILARAVGQDRAAGEARPQARGEDVPGGRGRGRRRKAGGHRTLRGTQARAGRRRVAGRWEGWSQVGGGGRWGGVGVVSGLYREDAGAHSDKSTNSSVYGR